MNPGTLDPQSDVDMDDSYSANQTLTSIHADKKTREVDDEGSASEDIRTHSALKEKDRRHNEGARHEEPIWTEDTGRGARKHVTSKLSQEDISYGKLPNLLLWI